MFYLFIFKFLYFDCFAHGLLLFLLMNTFSLYLWFFCYIYLYYRTLFVNTVYCIFCMFVLLLVLVPGMWYKFFLYSRTTTCNGIKVYIFILKVFLCVIMKDILRNFDYHCLYWLFLQNCTFLVPLVLFYSMGFPQKVHFSFFPFVVLI